MLKKIIILMLTVAIVPLCSGWSDELPVQPEGIERVEILSKRTYLAHDWKYIADDSPTYAAPDCDDSTWQSTQFPVVNFFYDLSKSHFYWFRKTFFVSDGIKGDPRVGYACQKLPEATQLYFNGSLIATSGSMPPQHYFGTGEKCHRHACLYRKAVWRFETTLHNQ
jgi:hypothetical protein